MGGKKRCVYGCVGCEDVDERISNGNSIVIKVALLHVETQNDVGRRLSSTHTSTRTRVCRITTSIGLKRSAQPSPGPKTVTKHDV